MKVPLNTIKQFPSSNSNRSLRCKYCYRPGHTDTNCRQKCMKRPPTMPEWISKVECKKCKKNRHLSFNCPPKYDNKSIKHKNDNRYNKLNNRESANLCEFAGMASHYNTNYWTCAGTSHSHKRKPRSYVKNFCVHKNKLKYPCVTELYPQHVSNMIYSFGYHRKEIAKICNTKSKILQPQ